MSRKSRIVAIANIDRYCGVFGNRPIPISTLEKAVKVQVQIPIPFPPTGGRTRCYTFHFRTCQQRNSLLDRLICLCNGGWSKVITCILCRRPQCHLQSSLRITVCNIGILGTIRTPIQRQNIYSSLTNSHRIIACVLRRTYVAGHILF